MSEQTLVEVEAVAKNSNGDLPAVPVGMVPTPTREYREHRKARRAVLSAGQPALPSPNPIPLPINTGTRVLIFKQDPSVKEIGIRKAFLPGAVMVGPRDGRIRVQGMAVVNPNVFGDFIETPGTDAFDAVHAFAIVRQTVNMYQRALGATLKWQWNSGSNADPIDVYPHAGVTMNAFYSRSLKALKFFFFDKPGAPSPPPQIFTCRSLDIVSHETGHAVLDSLKPNWIMASSTPQTGALHESFGDLTAIFTTLSQFDQVEAIIAQTKARLHDKTFLSDLAEEFGLALGRPNGLRNADNDLKLSQVGTEVHDLSQVFTGGIYDVLADLFVLNYRLGRDDPAAVLFDTGRYVCSLLLRAIQAAPASNATFADVVNQMLQVTVADGKPQAYRNSIRNQFTRREVVVSPTPLNQDLPANAILEAVSHESLRGAQTRYACCGTMQSLEYAGEDLESELRRLSEMDVKAAPAAKG
jgi:hypothetical protein